MTAQEAPGPRLTTRQVAGDALGLLRASFDGAWPWWFFLFVLETGDAARAVLMAPPAAAAGHPAAAIPPLTIGLTLVAGAIGAVLGGFALRTMIAGHKAPARLDLGLLGYVALTFAAEAIWTLLSLAASPLAERLIAYQGAAPPPPDLLPQALGVLALFGVLAFVFTRLALWPMARLTGAKAIGLVQSWRRMKGAVWPLIAASLVVVMPVTLVGGLILTSVQGPTPGLTLAAAPLIGLMAAVSRALQLAVMAAIWRARIGVKVAVTVTRPPPTSAAD